MTPSELATALDYADALTVARKAKNWLAGALLGMLLVQLIVFFVYRYANPPAAVLDGLHYLIGLIDFLGIVCALLLALSLLLIVNIMLVGRLIGLTRIMWAFLWCAALILLLFPWQAFLDNAAFSSTDFKIPGVLYTWEELLARARWVGAAVDWHILLLRWARFVVFPIAAIVMLTLTQLQSSRGLALAQGETRVDES